MSQSECEARQSGLSTRSLTIVIVEEGWILGLNETSLQQLHELLRTVAGRAEHGTAILDIDEDFIARVTTPRRLPYILRPSQVHELEVAVAQLCPRPEKNPWEERGNLAFQEVLDIILSARTVQGTVPKALTWPIDGMCGREASPALSAWATTAASDQIRAVRHVGLCFAASHRADGRSRFRVCDEGLDDDSDEVDTSMTAAET